MTAQKMKFSIKDFLSECDQIRWKLRIWSHLLRKSLMENFILCVVHANQGYQSFGQILLSLCKTSRLIFFLNDLCKQKAVVRRCSSKLMFLKYFANFIGKHLCSGMRACNFIKKSLQHGCFPVKFAK